MRDRWLSALGLVIAAVLMWWLLRGEDPAEIWRHVRGADFGLLALAVAITTLTFPVRAIRWKYFLTPSHAATPLRSRFAAVCIGFMANNLLPVRVGELARAYSYSRLEPVSATASFATLVVERFLDGAVILLLLFAALASPGFPADELPGEIVTGVRWISAVLGAILLGSAALAGFPRRTLALAERAAARLLPGRIAGAFVGFVGEIVGGLSSLRGWRLMLPAFAWSLVVWLLQSLSFWVGFHAFDIRLPFAAAVLTNAAVAMAVAIPSAPGFVGTFHAGASLALAGVYGVAAAPALGFAFGWHLGSFFPVTFLGLWHAGRLGLSLRDIANRRRPAPGGDRAGDVAAPGGERAGDAAAPPAGSP